MVVSVNIANVTVLLVNVYVKSDIWEIRTQNDYLQTVSALEPIITNMKLDNICVLL